MMREYSLTAESAMELYDFLRLHMGLTKRQIARLKFQEHGIRVNGEKQRVSYALKHGDLVTVCLEEGMNPSAHLVLTEGSVDILYEDEDVCVVNKPAGVPTHPSGGHYGDSMANLLMNYFHGKGESLRIRPIGRLDLETSGALAFAKNQTAAARMARQRERKLLGKEYLAVVTGSLSKGVGAVDLSLMKDPENPSRVLTVADPAGISQEGAKDAHTRYQVIREYEGYSAVRVQILTGRMHQIRAHMAAIGHPLLGDVLYGGSRDRIGRTALHAASLTFRQPITGEEIRLEAPIPEDIERLLLDK